MSALKIETSSLIRGAMAAAVLLALFGAPSCTDTGLYKWTKDPYQANKLAVSGRVCSDDPRQRNFPVKILFLVDTSQTLLDPANDNGGERGKAVNDVITTWSKNTNYSFGVISFGGQVRNLVDGGFTRDTSLLGAAATTVQGSSGGCKAGRCRDLESAVNLASSIITGDILAGDAGEIARTSYVVVLFAGGAQSPPLGRCACRDQDAETEPDKWVDCPWTECDASPAAGQIPACPTTNYAGTSCPDTFTHWVLPKDPAKNGLDTVPAGCNPCELCCVFPTGGRTESCEERRIVGTVRSLKSFATDNGAAQLQFHTTYLPDLATRTPPDPFAPLPCQNASGADVSVAADRARVVRLLSEMAFAGGGSFKQFYDDATKQKLPITFEHVDLFTAREPLVIKELVVTNANALPTDKGLRADSDQDGLPDEQEQRLGTCPQDPDSDSDGVNDLIELKLARDPLKAEDPIECVDLEVSDSTSDNLCPDPKDPAAPTTRQRKIYLDRDKDGLNSCEERLLGTSDSLIDSDADGIPDRVELVAGTNYLSVDPLQDPDFDGILNRDEVRGHTDPRANDAQEQLDLAYRYEELDEGIKDVLSFTEFPPRVSGVLLRAVSGNSNPGIGQLKFDPGDATNPPTLSWTDPFDVADGKFGAPVDVSVPNKEGYILRSGSEERFITVWVDGKNHYPPKTIVDKIIISSARKNCLRFRVRNITLIETLQAYANTSEGLFKGAAGDNNIFLYFAEAPKEAKDGFGIFRIANTVPNYKLGPPETRTPKNIAEVTFTDDDFIIFE